MNPRNILALFNAINAFNHALQPALPVTAVILTGFYAKAIISASLFTNMPAN